MTPQKAVLHKGRTIRKVMGVGGGGTKKKFVQGKMPRKKIHAEGRSNGDFFRKSEFQKSTVLPGTILINNFWP